MKKRIKNNGSYKRFYASGIPMYRERNKPIEVPAGTMVNVIKVKTQTAICEIRCTRDQKKELGIDSMILSIPLDNFAGDKLTYERAAKKANPKTKKGVKTPKAVPAETPTPEVTPVAVPAETQTVETVPVAVVEVETNAALVETPAVEPVAETVPAEPAAV